MIQLEEKNNSAKAHNSNGFSQIARELVVFFAATLLWRYPRSRLRSNPPNQDNTPRVRTSARGENKPA